ncbi:MAG: hypothetical protein E6K86_01965 [Thaumarchaeota archaeon]|nr:MAG: hypothetical protein E6K86_01965 [Nitrososphaerota archaeon]
MSKKRPMGGRRLAMRRAGPTNSNHTSGTCRRNMAPSPARQTTMSDKPRKSQRSTTDAQKPALKLG